MSTPESDSNCCGVVSHWDVDLDVKANVTLYLQVWRATSGSSYQLVGENAFSIGIYDIFSVYYLVCVA